MSYIQDKLDEMEKLLKNRMLGETIGHDVKNQVLVKKLIEQSLKDYHNHIVEKVKERFESGEYEMEDGFSYENGIDLSEIPNELFIEFKGIKKGMLGITNYIKKDLIKLLNNI